MLSRNEKKEILRDSKAWEYDKEYLEKKYVLKQEKKELKQKYNKSKMPSTSKMLIAFLFISCTLIEIFTGYVTIRSFQLAEMTMMSPDLSPLISLIGSIVSETIGFAIYAIKSTKENTKGGIVYDSAMAQINNAMPTDEGF